MVLAGFTVQASDYGRSHRLVDCDTTGLGTEMVDMEPTVDLAAISTVSCQLSKLDREPER